MIFSAQGGDSIVLLTETLEWLTPLTPELAMNIVRQMLDVDIDWLVDTFKPHPKLLLSYLEERAGDNQQVCFVDGFDRCFRIQNSILACLKRTCQL